MQKKILLSIALVSSLFADSEIDALKVQLNQQQQKLEALEAKERQLEKQALSTSTNQSASFSQNAYLPDMAFILNMSAVSRNVKNADYVTDEDAGTGYAIPGFIEAGTAEIPFNANQGFNFNYAEVALASTVDPYFDAFAIFHLSDGFEVEEAFVRTRALPYGVQVKAGKFRSAFGRINEKHQHSWQFDSQPIIYEALFGPDVIKDAGIQAQWVAPTDMYIMAGAEAFAGTNEDSFGATSENKHLYIGYLKSSVDIGDDFSALAGVSLAHGSNINEDTAQINPTDVYGVDLTLREQLGSYSSIIWQSEYLQREKKFSATRTDKQSGLYSELSYQYNNNWSAGARYDRIGYNRTKLPASLNGIDTKNLERYTAKVDYHPFPMSRLRLQYTYDRTKVIAGERKDVNEVVLSLNIAAGAHGAHNY